MGIVGKDTIMEQGGSFYEVLDLGFGVCRFALAARAGADFYGGYRTKVIATKYPAVTRRFFEGRNMDVDIVKIEGSVELAPLLGLADAIVDIGRNRRDAQRERFGRAGSRRARIGPSDCEHGEHEAEKTAY